MSSFTWISQFDDWAEIVDTMQEFEAGQENGYHGGWKKESLALNRFGHYHIIFPFYKRAVSNNQSTNRPCSRFLMKKVEAKKLGKQERLLREHIFYLIE